MEKKISVILAVIVCLSILCFGIWQYKIGQQTEPALEPEQKEAVSPQEETKNDVVGTDKEPDVKSEDVVWKKYKNKALGFSMSFPEKTGVRNWCEDKTYMAPVKVFEDNTAGIVYFVPEYYFGMTDKEYAEGCKKKYYSLALIKQEIKEAIAENGSAVNPTRGLAFWIENIRGDQELDKFIKKTFSADCALGDKTIWAKQDNVYGVTAKGVDGTDMTSDLPACFINWRYALLYHSEQGKILYVSLGQDSTFMSEDLEQEYDTSMFESFRFE